MNTEDINEYRMARDRIRKAIMIEIFMDLFTEDENSFGNRMWDEEDFDLARKMLVRSGAILEGVIKVSDIKD